MGRHQFGKVDDAWDVLLLALPRDWRKLAQDTGASKGLRKDKRLANLLRLILLHLGCGWSLRKTANVSLPEDLPPLRDVTLLQRERRAKDWLHALCVRLFEDLRLAVLPKGASQVWTVDAATVKEQRPRGSQWCVYCSVSLPSLACDLLPLPKTEGPDMGKSLARFPIRAADHVLAGRGYSTAWGIRQVADAGGRVIVPVDTRSLLLRTATGQPFDLLEEVKSVPHDVRSWATPVVVPADDGGLGGGIAGRVCVLRKSQEALSMAQEQVREDPAHKGNQEQPSTLRFADYETVFTTFPGPLFSAADVLDWYRLRQPVDLVFGHFWVLAQLGAVPKSDDSVKSWFYAKLLMALLVEKLMRAVSDSDNVSACRSKQRQFVFDAVANAIEPTLLRVRHAGRTRTKGDLGRRIRARSRSAASGPLPDGTPEHELRQLYLDWLERLETLVDRCA